MANLFCLYGSPEKDWFCVTFHVFKQTWKHNTPCLEFLSGRLYHSSHRRSLKCCSVVQSRIWGNDETQFSWVWWESRCPCWWINLCCPLIWTLFSLHLAWDWPSSFLHHHCYGVAVPCVVVITLESVFYQQWVHLCHSVAYQQLTHLQWRPSSLFLM